MGLLEETSLKGFLKRHQEILSIRHLTGTSQVKTNTLTKERIYEYYNTLDPL